MEPGSKKSKPCPVDGANPLSVLLFWWTRDMVQQTRQEEWQPEDLYDPPKNDKAEQLGDRLLREWERQEAAAAKSGGKPSLHRAILRAFAWDITVLAVQALLLNCVLKLLQPMLLGRLLVFFRPGSDMSLQEAAGYSGGLLLVFLASAVLNSHNGHLSGRVGAIARAACCSIVYRKSVRLSQAALTDTATGKIVNLLSTDVARFDVLVTVMHWVWVSPITAGLCVFLLCDGASYASLAGVGMVLLSLPLQALFSHLTLLFRRAVALKTDERVRLMDDVICGIRVIKMYAWEKPFSAIVYAARKSEMGILNKLMFTRTFIMSLLQVALRLAVFATVLAMYYVDHSIPADKVFFYISLISILTNALCLQMTLSALAIVEGYFSIGRLQSFMVQEEFCEVKSRDMEEAQQGDEAVVLRNLSAKWVATAPEETLISIDLQIPKGQLVVIIGKVGSGKSSLLQALMGELPSSSEQLVVNGRLSYAGQDPWVFPASLRQNILFSQPLDQRRYAEVLGCCALEQDLKQLQWGDSTLVGARGVSLSGGQKARLNLARAVYQEADIYLLDDPLSAVDTNVGRHLFRECICNFLKGKTRILVTHQQQYLEEADYVMLMNNGHIALQGTYQQLCDSGVDFGRMVGLEQRTDSETSLDAQPPPEQMLARRRLSRVSSKLSIMTDEESCEDCAEQQADNLENASKIRGSACLQFLKLGMGWCGVVTLVSSFLLLQVAFSACDYWVSYWVSVEETRVRDAYQVLIPTNDTEDTVQIELDGLLSGETCVHIYMALAASVLLLMFVRCVAFLETSVKSAQVVHNAMFDSVMHTWNRFFDTNPPGRILNRFSKDLSSIDETLQKSLFDASQMLLILLGNLVVITIINQLSLAALSLLVLVCVFVRNYYLKTSNNLKMLDGITKSPVFSHLHSTLQGLAAIRACGAQKLVCKQFDHHQDAHTSANYCYCSVNSAFTFVLDLLYVTYTTCMLVTFLVQEDTTGSAAGLIISQLISTSLYLQWGIRQSAELANNMTSVERVLEYTQLPPETNAHSGTKPPDDWPSQGEIQFEHVYLKYGERIPFVLVDLNVTIAPKEKVGIVGRTGAGKSSLIASLLRTAWVEGFIRIDGLDTGEVSLQELRSRMSIIPQDPVLFSGTLRFNLDPFNVFSDSKLWSVLQQVGLKNVTDEALGLETPVREGGSNLSVGQRQLVCLARAILRSSRILLLDEATANVDTRTDEILQTTIREQFAECTVLTVAHRLNTVMDCDRVMVMDKGRLAECDEPHVLLQNKGGLFYKMVQRTGAAMAEKLTQAAAQKHASRQSQTTRL